MSTSTGIEQIGEAVERVQQALDQMAIIFFMGTIVVIALVVWYGFHEKRTRGPYRPPANPGPMRSDSQPPTAGPSGPAGNSGVSDV